jgi:DNA-binding transcriptional regulator YiaG|tara:strand:- start:97067 stop:97471 length:405 start_codon:yes stop_codon:yes gene_type:complete
MSDTVYEKKETKEAEQRELMESRIDLIKASYESLDDTQREFLLEELGGLVTRIQQDGLGRIPVPFDKDRARQLREDADLTQGDLASQLNLGFSGSSTISRIETGRTTPGNPPKVNSQIRYLDWLKANGYNPYRL